MNEVAVAAFNFANNFGFDVAISRDRPVHVGDGNVSVGLRRAAFGVEEVEVDDVASFETEAVGVGLRCAWTGIFDLTVVGIIVGGAWVFDVLNSAGGISDVING